MIAVGRRRAIGFALLTTVLLTACESQQTPPAAAVLTLAKLRDAFRAAPTDPFGVGLSKVFPGGFPPAYFIASDTEIHVASAYTDGAPTAYMTTDLWVNVPAVWVQPLYIFVSAWDNQAPSSHWIDAPWLAGVGTDSAFWSPFWRVYYVEVPPGTDVGRLHTVRAIADAHLPIYPGPLRLMTITPGLQPEPAAQVLLPSLRTPDKIGLPHPRRVWVDGANGEQTGLDFGENRFEVNEYDQIVDQPLFFFFNKNASGQWAPVTSVPRVGGTGPLFSNTLPRAPGNRPIFGSFWRLWAVHLPSTAKVFVPPARHDEWAARSAPWDTPLPVAEPPATFAGAVDLDAYAFKVLLDDDCLTRDGAKPDDLVTCSWLDSQANLEKYLPAALLPSEIVVTCPFLSYDGAAVPPPTP